MHAFGIINALVESIRNKHRIYTNGEEYTLTLHSQKRVMATNYNV